MGIEIERKFLMANDDWKNLGEGVLYHQAYLSKDAERTIRVRIVGEQAYLTVKGKSIGISRLEYEYEIPVFDAEEMIEKLCLKPSIKKYRYRIEYEGFIWEVDEFLGENKGLVFAEIELKFEGQNLKIPNWIGKEVTGDPKYFNSNLISNPFKNWK